MREREDAATARQALDDWLRQRPSAAIVIAAIALKRVERIVRQAIAEPRPRKAAGRRCPSRSPAISASQFLADTRAD